MSESHPSLEIALERALVIYQNPDAAFMTIESDGKVVMDEFALRNSFQKTAP